MVDRSTNEQTNGKLDILKFYRFQQAFSEFQVTMLTLVKSQVEFNDELSTESPEPRRLSDLGSNISLLSSKLDKLFNCMEGFSISNTKYLELYAQFKIEILFDVSTGKNIIEKIQSIEKKKIRYKDYQLEDVNTINEDTSYLMVSVSANPDSFGKILGVGSQISSMFEYKESDVVGENVRILMPRIIGSVHDQFMLRYFETGEARIMGSNRGVFALKKSGHIFFCELFLTVLPVLDHVAFSHQGHPLGGNDQRPRERPSSKTTVRDEARFWTVSDHV